MVCCGTPPKSPQEPPLHPRPDRCNPLQRHHNPTNTHLPQPVQYSPKTIPKAHNCRLFATHPGPLPTTRALTGHNNPPEGHRHTSLVCPPPMQPHTSEFNPIGGYTPPSPPSSGMLMSAPVTPATASTPAHRCCYSRVKTAPGPIFGGPVKKASTHTGPAGGPPEGVTPWECRRHAATCYSTASSAGPKARGARALCRSRISPAAAAAAVSCRGTAVVAASAGVHGMALGLRPGSGAGVGVRGVRGGGVVGCWEVRCEGGRGALVGSVAGWVGWA